MEKKSRSELIKIIETQTEKLTRYETKLRDVVSAYKNLLKEKEALDASIKVLTTTQQQIQTPKPQPTPPKTSKTRPDHDQPERSNDESKVRNTTPATSPLTEESPGPVSMENINHPLMQTADDGTEEVEDEKCKDPTDESKDDKSSDSDSVKDGNDGRQEESEEIVSLKGKISTLSSTLQTVMEQKAIMESNYQADKRKMMQDFETKQTDLLLERETMEQKLDELEKQLKEAKQRMRQEQRSREEEQNDNMLMLRELQLLLSTERAAREELDQQLDEVQERLVTSKAIPESKAQEYELCIRKLKEELETIQIRLRKAEDNASKPSPFMLRLQEEMEEMKRENGEALLREQRRANEAEERLKMLTRVEEGRVSDLESKLSELSEVVGHYEKMKFQDQLVIQKLKERLQQLDVENTALSQHSPTTEIQDNRFTDKEMESLREHVDKLKAALKFAIENSGITIEGDLEGLSKSELDSILNSDPTHRACQQELRQLKDEFELYKSCTSTQHKNKSYKDTTAQLENLEKLKSRNNKVEKRLLELQETAKKKEEHYNKQISEVEIKLKTTVEGLTQEKESQELAYKHKLSELEKQVLKQRERTIQLLAEKDAEINSLRTRSPGADPTGVGTGVFSYPRRYLDPELMQPSEEIEVSEEQSVQGTNAAVCQLITRQTGVSSSEGVLIHFAQQQARREAENAALRRQKIEMEDEMRDMSLRESKHEQQCEMLKEEIRKLERDRSRESANLEYLKNIVLRFMLATSYSVRHQMIVAIATILEFSPLELQQVQKSHASGWWK